MIDRSEVNRALAKALAFKQCGKDREAALWAAMLVEALECAEILQPGHPAVFPNSQAVRDAAG
jgi:hypothetical protein